MKLQVCDVYYSYQTKYQTRDVLCGVTAKFQEGKFYAIMGPSGGGKTPLLYLMAGLDIPKQGEILYNGKSLSQQDRDVYRKEHVSVIYQNFNLFSHLSVLENVMYPLICNGIRRKEAEEFALEKLGCVGLSEEQGNRFPNMLSGGEQQRVAIARALAVGSEIILADEPTGNLDEENSGKIVKLLEQLAHESQRCVVVVTHDEEVGNAADVKLHMQSGKFAEK